MLTIMATYIITFTIKDYSHVLRVNEDQVGNFIQILLFNRCTFFSVKLETLNNPF